MLNKSMQSPHEHIADYSTYIYIDIILQFCFVRNVFI